MMILVITRKNDRHGEHMVAMLSASEEKVQVLDYETYPNELAISFVSNTQGVYTLLKFSDGMVVDSREVKSVLNRRQAEPKASASIHDTQIASYIVRESRNFLDALPNIIDAFWFSNPDAIRIASRKPYQALLAQGIGFQVPETLITNDPDAVKSFAKNLKTDVACKALLTPGITLEQNGDKQGVMLYTQRLSVPEIFSKAATVKNCPLIFQPYVEKEFELRITVVGTQVFSCAIYSQNSTRTREDWRRYDLTNTPHQVYQLPPDIEARCVSLVRELGLVFGCIDMIVTPSGEYIFLEINPNGQWLWIEHLTKMPISQAIEDLLIHPPVQ